MLEDLGFFVIDNLPPDAHRQGRRARPRHASSRSRYALVVDVRSRRLPRTTSSPRSTSCAQTARTHARPVPRRLRRRARAPLRGEPAPPPALRHRSRQRRHRARARAARRRSRARPTSSSTRRTSTCTSSATACASCSPSDAADGALQINIVSFGYKHGLPLDVDLVFDCRFLPNPHWVEELRPLTGLDAPVRDYVLAQPETERVPRRARPAVRAAAARLRARGQGVPVDRRRLHRRPAPQRRDRRASSRELPRERHRRIRDRASPPGRRPCADAAPTRRPAAVVALGGGHGLADRAARHPRVRGVDHRGRQRRRRRRLLGPAAPRPRRARRPATCASASSRSPATTAPWSRGVRAPLPDRAARRPRARQPPDRRARRGARRPPYTLLRLFDPSTSTATTAGVRCARALQKRARFWKSKQPSGPLSRPTPWHSPNSPAPK